MLAACARGLDLIDAHLGTLGATELRAQATAQGDDLARLAMGHAARTGDAGRLLEWSERWRATALAVPPVRLDVDPELTRDLAALRVLARRLDDEPCAGRSRGPARAAASRGGGSPAGAAPAGRRFRAGSGPVRVAELRSLLGSTDLVELTEVDRQLFAVVLSGDRPPAMHHVGELDAAERALAHALFALRREGAHRGGTPLDLRPIGARLEQALLGPVVETLAASSVVVVPTGGLHAVPWALLPGLRGRAVTVAPSAAFWLRGQRSLATDGGRVVLVGGPHLSTGATEVRRLAERYPEAVVLAGGDATSERVLAAMDGARLVHVAAHGTFRSDSPLLSALELDDGPLTVYDLERLGRAPHRVVLSSCNSAVGAPSGADELLGVVSALMTLGSVGVVASVVPVDDPSTVPFMLALHRLMQDQPLGRALVEARRAVRDDPVGEHRRGVVHRPRSLNGSQAHPVGDQAGGRRRAPEPDHAGRHRGDHEEPEVVHGHRRDHAIVALHLDLAAGRRRELADHPIGEHLDLHGPRARRRTPSPGRCRTPWSVRARPAGWSRTSARPSAGPRRWSAR